MSIPKKKQTYRGCILLAIMWHRSLLSTIRMLFRIVLHCSSTLSPLRFEYGTLIYSLCSWNVICQSFSFVCLVLFCWWKTGECCFDSLCIMNLQIKTPAQLEAAILYLDNTAPEDFKLNEFEEACGVGRSFSVSNY